MGAPSKRGQSSASTFSGGADLREACGALQECPDAIAHGQRLWRLAGRNAGRLCLAKVGAFDAEQQLFHGQACAGETGESA